MVRMTLELAQTNIDKFVTELGLDSIRVGRVSAMDRGLYHCFTLLNGETNKPYTGKFCYIEVPSVELDVMKSSMARGKPFYIDSSLWYWRFALGIVRDLLLGVVDE